MALYINFALAGADRISFAIHWLFTGSVFRVDYDGLLRDVPFSLGICA